MSLIHITTCVLCADRANAFRVEEQGFEIASQLGKGEVPARLQEFQLKLLGHIQKAAQWEWKQLEKALKLFNESGGHAPDQSAARHFNAWVDFQARTALAQGISIMNAYETTDPALLSMREMARLRLNTATRRMFFTDEQIEDAVVRLNLDPQDQQNVTEFAKQMRDALMEQGKYAPNFEQPTSLVV